MNAIDNNWIKVIPKSTQKSFAFNTSAIPPSLKNIVVKGDSAASNHYVTDDDNGPAVTSPDKSII